ncbi:MAG: ABC transporter substrate-binding protein [Nitrospira sp.]|nr:ABC transporter substrate-binding protein [Nitrospira sp.]
MIASLGLADHLVGISHECDFPPSIRQVPVMIEPLVETHLTTSLAIDQRVKELVASGSPLYHLDERALHQARPDMILTQDLCHVCAVTPGQLARAIQSLQPPPDVLTLSPTTLGEVIHDVERIAGAVDRLAKGQALATELRRRLDSINRRNARRHSRPRVVCLEWLDPLYIGGHWVPEMIDLAGGCDVLGSTDAPSRQTTWREVETAHPDVIILMPCGFSIDRTINELQAHDRWRRACEQWPNLYIVDAASYFSRPGPRLVDGVELLDSILHPSPGNGIDPVKAIKLEASILVGGGAP